MVHSVGEPAWLGLDPQIAFEDSRDTAFISGVRSGVGRVKLTGAVVDVQVFWTNFVGVARRPLADLMNQRSLDPHGIAFLGEMIATAVAVRVAHDEEPLTEDEVAEALPAFLNFFNTIITGCNPH